jgi:hypothetical protein
LPVAQVPAWCVASHCAAAWAILFLSLPCDIAICGLLILLARTCLGVVARLVQGGEACALLVKPQAYAPPPVTCLAPLPWCSPPARVLACRVCTAAAATDCTMDHPVAAVCQPTHAPPSPLPAPPCWHIVGVASLRLLLSSLPPCRSPLFAFCPARFVG